MHPMGFPIHEASLISKFLSINLLYRYLATSSPLIFHRRWKLWSTKKKTHTPAWLSHESSWLVFATGIPKIHFMVCLGSNPHRSLGYNPGPFIRKKIIPYKKPRKNSQLSLDPATFAVRSLAYLQRFRGTKRKVTKMLIIARRPLLNSSGFLIERIPWGFWET